MDPIWQTLPADLTAHVCNQLPKVRKIPDALKKQIEERTIYVHKCEYPVVNGLCRAYNCRQVPDDGHVYTVEPSGKVKGMFAEAFRQDDGTWIWNPIETSYSSYRTNQVPFTIRIIT